MAWRFVLQLDGLWFACFSEIVDDFTANQSGPWGVRGRGRW